MSNDLTAEQVRSWLASISDELHQLELTVKPLLDERQRLEARQQLLQNLLDSFGPEPASRELDRHRPSRKANGSVGEYVIGRATELLREEGQPLHINDLHARFLQRGYSVPGAGKAVNLIVHLRRAEQIVQPRRGMYGLVEQVGSLPKPTRRKRRRSAPKRRPQRKE